MKRLPVYREEFHENDQTINLLTKLFSHEIHRYWSR